MAESPASHRRRSPAATAEGRWLTGKVTGGGGGAVATRRRTPGGELTAAGRGGSGEVTAERLFHVRAKADLLEARTASSELRFRRFRWLWLRLVERNTMMVLHARNTQWLGSYGCFTKTAELKLKAWWFCGGYLGLRSVVTSWT